MQPNPLFPADLLTFIKEIFNGKIHNLSNFVLMKISPLNLQNPPQVWDYKADK